MKGIYVSLLLLFSVTSYGALTIDSVRTTISTCPNNGGISIFASTNNGPILYSIIAGPETRPLQNGSTFNGLRPGTYTISVTNFINETVTSSVTITTNYTEPDFSPVVVNINCRGTFIIGKPNLAISKKPFSWELTHLSTGAVVTQASDSFNVLRTGTYNLRMFDSCQNFVTRSVIVNIIDTSVNAAIFGSIVKTGCDTFVIKIDGSVPAAINSQQLTIKVFDLNDTSITYLVPVLGNYVFPVYDTLYALSYGGDLQMSIEPICGRKIISPSSRIAPYKFTINFSQLVEDCGNIIYEGNIIPDPDILYNYFPTEFRQPVVVTVKDIDSNKIVQVLNMSNDITPKVPGRNYLFTITDGCGTSYSFDTIWPLSTINSASVAVQKSYGCIDSTSTVAFTMIGFYPPIKLEIISGPEYLHSTKTGFSYLDSITYPQVHSFNYAIDFFPMKNFPAGIYQYRVSDTCGHVVTSSFQVLPQDVADLHNTRSEMWYKKGCLNGNTLFYKAADLGKTFPLQFDIVDLFTRQGVYSGNITDTLAHAVPNIPTGEYEMMISAFLNYQRINENINQCVLYRDTLKVDEYQRPRTSGVSVFECNGSINAVLIPDTVRGVPPYKYEIISGPQLYPQQSSNVFTAIPPGVYTSRIVDTCGNSNVLDFSVDTILFPKIAKSGISCIAGETTLFFESSPYFEYRWKKPDGSIFIGDSLHISAVAATDTGMYLITRYVALNNCTDSSSVEYRLSSNIEINYNRTICQGDTAMLLSRVYSQSGTYADTVRSSTCDTVFTLTLVVLNSITNFIDTAICSGNSIQFGNSLLTVAGIYSDTFQTSRCDSIATLDLKIIQAVSLQISASDTFVITGDSIRLFSDSPIVFANYSWTPASLINFPNAANPIAIVNASTWFKLIVQSADGCKGSDSIFIQVQSSCGGIENVYLPNAFTPNDDGVNDLFVVRSKSLLRGKLLVFDRLGNTVFTTDDLKNGWDGKIKDQSAPQDVYGFYFEGECSGGEKFRLKGNISLLR